MVVAVDVGTSSCKAVLFDMEGNELMKKRENYEVSRPREGFAEHEPGKLESAVLGCLKELVEETSIDGENVNAVGVTGLGRGIVALDSSGNPVRPAILSYMDSRTDEVDYEFSDLNWGNTMIYKNLLYIKQNEPERFCQIDNVVDTRDYIGHILTGEISRNSFGLSEGRLQEVNREHGFSDELFPAPSSYEEPVGTVTAEIAEQTGIPEDTPVVVGPWDAICSAVGSGLYQDGVGMAVLGTTTLTATVLEHESEQANKSYFGSSKGLYLGAEAAGSAQDYLAEKFLDGDYDRLENLIDAAEPAEGPVIVPFLEGRRERPSVKGAIAELEFSHDLSDLVRSACEAEAYYIRREFEGLFEEKDVKLRELRLSGGRARSEARNQVISDILQIQVKTLETSETSALGIAILAAVSTGMKDDIFSAVEDMVNLKEEFRPRPRFGERYDKTYERFKQLDENLS